MNILMMSSVDSYHFVSNSQFLSDVSVLFYSFLLVWFSFVLLFNGHIFLGKCRMIRLVIL